MYLRKLFNLVGRHKTFGHLIQQDYIELIINIILHFKCIRIIKIMIIILSRFSLQFHA